MYIKASFLSLIAVTSLSVSYARELIIERNGRPFYPRRFGQEQCGGIGNQIGAACAGGVCGTLGGQVPGTLLAGAAECAQQDLADSIIDASTSQDATTAANMVALAVKFRQCEKNTPPDFTTNPPTLRNSVFCTKAPKNSQLNGLTQGQDPANDPNLFFDPATKSTVKLGAQLNTFAFGSAGAAAFIKSGGAADAAATSDAAATTGATAVTTRAEDAATATGTCPPANTVTVTAAASASTADASSPTDSAPASTSTDTGSVADVASSGSGSSTDLRADTIDTGALDFGSCTNPAVEFGPGFEGRKLSEFSFEPEDQTEFAQSSALNGQIVLTAICNILNDKCQAPAATVSACKDAVTAVANVDGGGKADQFNAALGIKTDFANVPAAAGGGVGSAEAATTADFNLCTVPQIAFGIFDGRTEDSFEPVGSDFSHGSALNPAIITTAVCDDVQSKCNANQVAINDCQAAIKATAGLSGQAVVTAFNAAVSAHVAK